MSKRYLIVSEDVLPNIILKVVEAKTLIEQKKVRGIAEATRKSGISRSSYYKYIDHIITLEEIVTRSQLTFSLTLSHKKGILSEVLGIIAQLNGNVISIDQNPPENKMANVHIVVDMSTHKEDINALVDKINSTKGVLRTHLIIQEDSL